MYLESMSGFLAGLKDLYIVDSDQKALIPWLPMKSGEMPPVAPVEGGKK
jgi:membrane protease subunit HflK